VGRPEMGRRSAPNFLARRLFFKRRHDVGPVGRRCFWRRSTHDHMQPASKRYNEEGITYPKVPLVPSESANLTGAPLTGVFSATDKNRCTFNNLPTNGRLRVRARLTSNSPCGENIEHNPHASPARSDVKRGCVQPALFSSPRIAHRMFRSHRTPNPFFRA